MSSGVAHHPKVYVWLRAWLKRDGIALALFALATVIMTYPLAFQPSAGLPSPGGDTITAIWQKWWLVQAVSNGLNAGFSPYLFHPIGLDVTFQTRPWTALGTWQLLVILFGEVAGYNLNVLLSLGASAYMMYLLVYELTSRRGAAWIGGAFFGFYPQHVQRHFEQGTTGNLVWIPLFLLGLVGLMRKLGSAEDTSRRFSSGAFYLGVAIVALSLSAYMSVKHLMFFAPLGALYVGAVGLFDGLWRKTEFWVAGVAFVIGALILSAPVVWPFLRAGWQNIQGAIEVYSPGAGADLWSWVRPAPNRPPFVASGVGKLLGIKEKEWSGGNFYLGLTTVGLAIYGLVDRKVSRRDRLIWFALALIYWVLALGVILRLNATQRPEIWMPYRLIADFPLFQAVRKPRRFSLVFTVPWAVLVGYGAAHVERAIRGNQRLARGVMASLAILMLYELSLIPIHMYPPKVSTFYSDHWLEEPEVEPGAIIDLPIGMGGNPVSMYLQTIHGRPVVAGRAARLPEEANAYIDNNLLLRAWKDDSPPICGREFEGAVEELLADGFQYVVLHNQQGVATATKNQQSYFEGVPLHFGDGWVRAYRLADLAEQPPCPN